MTTKLDISQFHWDKESNILSSSVSKLGIKPEDISHSFIMIGKTDSKVRFEYIRTVDNAYKGQMTLSMEFGVNSSWNNKFDRNKLPLMAVIEVK
jgi:hypothetical protein